MNPVAMPVDGRGEGACAPLSPRGYATGFCTPIFGYVSARCIEFSHDLTVFQPNVRPARFMDHGICGGAVYL